LYTGGASASGEEDNGIGYKVFVTPEILEAKIGDTVALFTYHKVAEDGQALFGLPDFSTLQFFEMLITVSGVGPKVALAILSSAKAETIKQAIASQDAAVFTKVAGVGTKTAEKIIVELKNKVGSFTSPGLGGASDVFDALLALGYGQREVREAVNKLDNSLSQQEQLKQALKLLGKS
jgi:Holliday junction DNA helicase RuvA